VFYIYTHLHSASAYNKAKFIYGDHSKSVVVNVRLHYIKSNVEVKEKKRFDWIPNYLYLLVDYKNATLSQRNYCQEVKCIVRCFWTFICSYILVLLFYANLLYFNVVIGRY